MPSVVLPVLTSMNFLCFFFFSFFHTTCNIITATNIDIMLEVGEEEREEGLDRTAPAPNIIDNAYKIEGELERKGIINICVWFFIIINL